MKNIFNSKLRKSDSRQRKVADGPGSGSTLTVKAEVSASLEFLADRVAISDFKAEIGDVSVDSYAFSFSSAENPGDFVVLSPDNANTDDLYATPISEVFEDVWDAISEEISNLGPNMTFGQFVAEHKVTASGELSSESTVAINSGGYTTRAELPLGTVLEIGSGDYKPWENWGGTSWVDITIDGQTYESRWSPIINIFGHYQVEVGVLLEELFYQTWKSDEIDYDAVAEEFGLTY